MDDTLRTIATSEKHEKRLEEVFETKKLDDKLYIKFNRSKFMDYLKAKCEVLTEKVRVSNILEGSGPDRLKRYSAHIIKDCLSKENAKLLDEVLGLQTDKENEPPAKKAKKEGVAEEPSEDYSKGEMATKVKAEVKMSKSQKDLAKAAKGTKSISSFFTPKKKWIHCHLRE